VPPGGFFKMFVYWDTYFTLLGLVVQGQWELAAGMVDNLVYAVERLGHVPGYVSAKTACRSRSQSPYLTAAILEILPYRSQGDPAWLARAAAAAEREYRRYWTAEPHLTDTGLSRYVDLGHNGCVTVPDTPHYRAWDVGGLGSRAWRYRWHSSGWMVTVEKAESADLKVPSRSPGGKGKRASGVACGGRAGWLRAVLLAPTPASCPPPAW
jgi:hypothetical protein